jgi:ATP diphosphatase
VAIKLTNSIDPFFSAEAVEDELGDLLFVCVNLARFMKVNPEQALNSTNHKFEMRFRAIEEHLEREGRDLDGESLEALDAVWQAVKGVEKTRKR